MLTLEDACTIAIEAWRVARLADKVSDGNVAAGLRYAARQVRRILERVGIREVDFAGRPYDAGMVPGVVAVRPDARLPAGSAIVDETVTPTITWRGHVVARGEIIVACSVARPCEEGSAGSDRPEGH
jgi:hypothetical protein